MVKQRVSIAVSAIIIFMLIIGVRKNGDIEETMVGISNKLSRASQVVTIDVNLKTGIVMTIMNPSKQYSKC